MPELDPELRRLPLGRGSRRQVGHARPDAVSDLSDDSGVDETRHDPAGGILGDLKVVLEPLESHSGFRFMNDMIHHGSHDFRAASLFATLDTHPILHPLTSARLVPESSSGRSIGWAEVFD